jgi:hypothetical protein
LSDAVRVEPLVPKLKSSRVEKGPLAFKPEAFLFFLPLAALAAN